MMVHLSCGTRVRGYFASQILSLTLRHEVSDIIPQDFEVVLTPFSFKARVHLNHEMCTVFMKGKQFPIISNSATTGHKLQGCTLAELAVFEQFYKQNWMYVVLSRVRTMKGLYLAEPLTDDLKKYAMAKNMKEMIADFETRIGMELYTESQYEAELTR